MQQLPISFFNPEGVTHRAAVAEAIQKQYWLHMHDINFIHRCGANCTRADGTQPYQNFCIAIPDTEHKAFLIGWQTGIGVCPCKQVKANGCMCPNDITFRDLVAIGFGKIAVAVVGATMKNELIQYAWDLTTNEKMLFFNPQAVARFSHLVLAYGSTVTECKTTMTKFLQMVSFPNMRAKFATIQFHVPNNKFANFRNVLHGLRTLEEWDNALAAQDGSPSAASSSAAKPAAATSPSSSRGRVLSAYQGGARASPSPKPAPKPSTTGLASKKPATSTGLATTTATTTSSRTSASPRTPPPKRTPTPASISASKKRPRPTDDDDDDPDNIFAKPHAPSDEEPDDEDDEEGEEEEEEEDETDDEALPEGWYSARDPNTGRRYYFDEHNHVTWRWPEGPAQP